MTQQPMLEEVKRHKVTGEVVLPLTSPIGLIGSAQGTRKDYLNSSTNKNELGC